MLVGLKLLAIMMVYYIILFYWAAPFDKFFLFLFAIFYSRYRGSFLKSFSLISDFSIKEVDGVTLSAGIFLGGALRLTTVLTEFSALPSSIY